MVDGLGRITCGDPVEGGAKTKRIAGRFAPLPFCFSRF